MIPKTSYIKQKTAAYALSKQLTDSLVSMLEGNREFIMLDDQKIVYETALNMIRKASIDKKQVLIAKGGPGTGKNVVAINLLVENTKNGLVSRYVSKNAAPPGGLCRQTCRNIKEKSNLQYARRFREFL